VGVDGYLGLESGAKGVGPSAHLRAPLPMFFPTPSQRWPLQWRGRTQWWLVWTTVGYVRFPRLCAHRPHHSTGVVLMWPWPSPQVVFVIISDIGIEKMEAQLVSIKDSLSKDVMLVRRLGRMRAYHWHALGMLCCVCCGFAHTAVYPSGPCCARPLPPTSGSEAASRLAWWLSGVTLALPCTSQPW
jgi:hypothetical protein